MLGFTLSLFPHRGLQDFPKVQRYIFVLQRYIFTTFDLSLNLFLISDGTNDDILVFWLLSDVFLK